MSDSSTRGFLAPAIEPAPLEDDALDDFLQAIVVGITGLSGTLVRPRYQKVTPNTPECDVDWAAIGVMHRRADTFAAELHEGAGEGSSTMIRHEELDLLCSFYGPNAQAYGARLRDGISIAQNREELTRAGMGLVSVGDIVRAPDLLKNQWRNRGDLPLTIRREIRRVYPVLNLLSAGGTIATDDVTTPFQVNP